MDECQGGAMSDKPYRLLCLCQASFAGSFGLMMCVNPLFFEFISNEPFDLHSQDCIRVCGPFVVLLAMMAYRVQQLAEDARRAFSQTCLVCYSMAVVLCIGGFQSGRWNWWLLVCAVCFTIIGVAGHGGFALFWSPGGSILRTRSGGSKSTNA